MDDAVDEAEGERRRRRRKSYIASLSPQAPSSTSSGLFTSTSLLPHRLRSSKHYHHPNEIFNPPTDHLPLCWPSGSTICCSKLLPVHVDQYDQQSLTLQQQPSSGFIRMTMVWATSHDGGRKQERTCFRAFSPPLLFLINETMIRNIEYYVYLHHHIIIDHPDHQQHEDNPLPHHHPILI